MNLKKTFPAILITLMFFLFAPASKAQCMGMNPKNCVRLNGPAKGQQSAYHKPKKQVKQQKWVDGKWVYSRRGARWVPGRWTGA